VPKDVDAVGASAPFAPGAPGAPPAWPFVPTLAPPVPVFCPPPPPRAVSVMIPDPDKIVSPPAPPLAPELAVPAIPTVTVSVWPGETLTGTREMRFPEAPPPPASAAEAFDPPPPPPPPWSVASIPLTPGGTVQLWAPVVVRLMHCDREPADHWA